MPLRVFLVDDLLGMRLLMQDLLAVAGGVQLVATASTEGEARLWLEDHAEGWDVAVIDLVLEQGSGLSVIAPSRARHPGGQVAVFSSYVTPVIRQHCLKLGAEAVFGRDESAEFIAWLRRLAGS